MTADQSRRVGDLSLDDFRALAAGPGLGVRIGPFDVLARVRVPAILPPLKLLYAHYPVLEGERVYSMRVELRPVRQRRPPFERRVRFEVDGQAVHEDLPVGQALAVLEWGINLVVAMRFYSFLSLHTAVLERQGRALVLPAAPGEGKTTLCAALSHRGWRLLSDEFGLVRPGTTALVPIPRPMPLKNESIAVIRRFAPEAVLGPEIPGTRKGTVAHVQPPRDSVDQQDETAEIAWLVFPRWRAGAPLGLETVPSHEAFMRLATNAFNYDKLGERGFTTVRDLIAGTRSYRLVYSDLDEAIAALNRLADESDG
jgi:HprK-related kinase A